MKAIVYTKFNPPEALRPGLSNQAHSLVTVRPGFFDTVLYFIAQMVSMLSPQYLAPDIGVEIWLLLVPTTIQKMVYAVWMIVKGFNPPAVASGPAKVDINVGENDVAKSCTFDRLFGTRYFDVERLPTVDKH